MFSPSRAEASEAFQTLLEMTNNQGKLILLVVSIHELEKGIAPFQHKKATFKVSDLKTWLEELISSFEDQIISFDKSTATVTGNYRWQRYRQAKSSNCWRNYSSDCKN